MKTTKNSRIHFSLLLGIFLLSDGCTKGPSEEVCNDRAADINSSKVDYYANPTVSNCQKVVQAYNDYINAECDDAESYINLRDAFQKKNCP
jgi:hypothetical protein